MNKDVHGFKKNQEKRRRLHPVKSVTIHNHKYRDFWSDGYNISLGYIRFIKYNDYWLKFLT